jgi:SAM-dependent methyltransferase
VIKDFGTEISTPGLEADLQRIYAARFEGLEAYRDSVWKILVSDFFSQWMKPENSVLDLGCGYCEFINNVKAAKKFGMDLNKESSQRIAPGIQLFQQDCSAHWPLEDAAIDVIFSSNFFEHLPDKASLQATLAEAYRCLKPGGYLIALGPNIKYLGGAYWDFFDHHLALTEASISEAMRMERFTVERAIPKFLPYTMSQGFRPPLWTLKLFLKMKWSWRIFGRQFLVVARR